MNPDWTTKEVKLIVEDYFEMLNKELTHQKYNKTQHRSRLLPMLLNRSHSAIENKHQNISSILREMGQPFIRGYKPLSHYQKILTDEIINYIINNRSRLEQEFDRFSNDPAILFQTKELDFENILYDDPFVTEASEEESIYFTPIKINYLEKEQSNRALGEAGEDIVIKYERWRLNKEGKDGLADKIEWISKEKGDGAGFDILSKNSNGTDRYIEVKTTKLSKDTPIYLTRIELGFASLKQNDFFLYRVYDFKTSPMLFIRQGHYENFCRLQPQVFKGLF